MVKTTKREPMADALTIKGAYLWNGIDDKLIPDGVVILENGIIKAVGPVAEIHSGTGELIDLPDATLIPGLIDSHTHLSMDPTLENYLGHMADDVAELTLRATAMMRKDLFSGVTTCRCPGDREFLDIACRKAVEEGLVPGPRLLVATRGIRAPHGHGFVGYPFEGKEGIRNAIRENVEKGADFIKIYITGTLKGEGELPSYLSREEIQTAIEEAHNAGVRIAAHCVGGEGLDWAIEFGLDSLEHVYHISDRQIEKMTRSDTWPVLTPSPILTESRVHHLPSDLIAGHLEERDEIASRMAAVIRSDIPFAVGTDGMHGELVQELAYLVELGSSPLTALRAATLNGAKVCGIENDTGSLEEGKFADIVAVQGNPLENINDLKNVIDVIKQGELVTKSRRVEINLLKDQ